MTTLQSIQNRKVAEALGVDFNSFLITSDRVEKQALVENESRIEIVEKPEDKVEAVFVDGNLVLFLCDKEDTDLGNMDELIEYLRN